ncbi:sperm flagellar protein 1 isoform X1 [Drosophila willistoni]|uniref:sperm flagellar protein 1 isoform X1 n=1 Tax=Drosophila willistoni TaxID=7260 RepID=UPI000C26D91B|nr:sperm flagellar protein 1 isoform X1 [Drosophila willistoni]
MSYACRKLKSSERKELAKWLKLQNLKLDRRMRQDLTDVVPVARIFQRFHIKLVNMHFYTHRIGADMKLQNWMTFNQRVLIKLGLGHNRLGLDQLAKGQVGAIESLLYDLMSMGRSTPPNAKFFNQHSQKQKYAISTVRITKKHSLTHVPQLARIVLRSPSVLCADVKRFIRGRVINVPEKLVAYQDYLDALQELREKDACINSIRHKTQYLESLIKVKDERIDDLMKQLEQLLQQQQQDQ